MFPQKQTTTKIENNNKSSIYKNKTISKKQFPFSFGFFCFTCSLEKSFPLWIVVVWMKIWFDSEFCFSSTFLPSLSLSLICFSLSFTVLILMLVVIVLVVVVTFVVGFQIDFEPADRILRRLWLINWLLFLIVWALLELFASAILDVLIDWPIVIVVTVVLLLLLLLFENIGECVAARLCCSSSPYCLWLVWQNEELVVVLWNLLLLLLLL